MSEQIERTEDGIDSLRCRMDADARFRRAISGYDPYEVRAYVENVKRIFAQQAKASKQEQETLIAQLESARSEIQARNYAIKKLKDILVQREAQLSSANTRINTLLQSVKKHDAEREELDRLRAAASEPDLSREQLQELQNEAQRLRAALKQSAEVLESWKTERTRLIEDNERLKQELYYQRSMQARPAPEYDYARPYAPANMPVRQQYADAYTAETRGMQQPMPPSRDFSVVADKLASMFADAYLLISQFRNSDAQPEQPAPRPAQPYMQILRPDSGNPDNPFNKK